MPSVWVGLGAPVRVQHGFEKSYRERSRSSCYCKPVGSLHEGPVTSSYTATTSTEAGPQAALQPLPTEGSPLAREQINLKCTIVNSIDKVDEKEWDACALGSGETNPFVLWRFLHALEASRSAVQEEGWLPTHITIREDRSGALLGCCPLYLKGHSYGEYVFDHSWAGLASRFGMQYYPKLQSCVPFSPVTGPRLLVNAPGLSSAVTRALIDMLKTVADNMGVSSLHMTFNRREEWEELGQHGFLQRCGIQYHWENQGYATFDHFLQDLKQSKRKNIRQERKKVAAEGLVIERLTGADVAKPALWDRFYTFYRNTTDRKWGQAYLTRDFFQRLGETMSNEVLLVVASEGGPGSPLVAGALNLIGSRTLFGRNWGSCYGRDIKNLHFELCYYQAVEAAIELGLERVEAGAQGEHKIQRGYLPSMTYSSHYIRDPAFATAISQYLHREAVQIEYTMEALRQGASPFKSSTDSSSDSNSFDSVIESLDA